MINRSLCWRCQSQPAPGRVHACPIGDTCECCPMCESICAKAARNAFVDEAQQPIPDVIKNAMRPTREREPIVIQQTTAGSIPVLMNPIAFERIMLTADGKESLEGQKFAMDEIKGWSLGVAYHRDKDGKIVLDHGSVSIEPVPDPSTIDETTPPK